MPADAEPRYIPATRWRIFTRLYDPALALAMRERRFRDLMRQRVSADLPSDGTAVDVGCGTGTFAIATPKSSRWRRASPAPTPSRGTKGWHRSSRWPIAAPT